MKTFSPNLYFFLIFFIFSISVDSQDIDADLLMELSDSNISLARNLLDGESIQNNLEENSDAIDVDETLLEIENDETNLESDDTEIGLKKFGYDFFSTMPTSVSAIGDLPLPNNYKISIKDQFSIILSGTRKNIFDLSVKLDGTILFPEIGSISVVGETFGEVKEKISNIVEQTFIGVQVDISLKSLSAKKITIVGAVNTPGTYLVNPFSTITGALAYSGGITEVGSLRNILLKRANGNVYAFDLYDLLINGDRSRDITIESGDTILINPAEQFVELNGLIRRPGIYEVLDSDNLGSLISFGLGLEKNANRSKILLSKTSDDFTANFEQETSDMETKLRNVFSVNVFPYLAMNQNKILVSGAVYEPGLYNSDQFSDLDDLISAMKFVEAYPWLAYAETIDDKDFSKEITIFSLKDPNTYKSISLNGDTKIHFFNVKDENFLLTDADQQTSRKINEYTLKVNFGEEQFSTPVIGNFNPLEILRFIGLTNDDYINEVAYIKPIEDEIIIGNINEMNIEATKFNTLQLRKPVDNIIEVFIQGEVNFPGRYSLKSGSTLTDLYSLAGGFKEQAFFNGIVFQRESVKENQLDAIQKSNRQINELLRFDLAENDNANIEFISSLSSEINEENLGRIGGDFSPSSSLSKEILLNNGDAIFIPKITNVISVVGEVVNPTSFVSNSDLNIADVIDRGGGFGSLADKRATYIISADGSIRKSSRNLFSGNSKLSPGDTLVVPRKVSQSGLEIITPISQILSNLAFSAAAIDNLKNN